MEKEQALTAIVQKSLLGAGMSTADIEAFLRSGQVNVVDYPKGGIVFHREAFEAYL